MGIDDIDAVLDGGLIPARSYILRGEASTGKTIFGFYFLAEGIGADDSCLFIAFEEPAEDFRENAATLGFELDDVEILDLNPDPERFLEADQYCVFPPDEIEGPSVTDQIVDAIETADPDRVFIDIISQLKYLSADHYPFRQEVAELMNCLKDRGATVSNTTQPMSSHPEDDLQNLHNRAITMSRSKGRRSVSRLRFRGSSVYSGHHSLRISDSGIEVYPKLVPGAHDREFTVECVGTGIDELDSLLGGGVERGAVPLISGPSGVGKSTTAAYLLKEAADRDELVAAFLFEECEASLRHPLSAIGLPIEELVTNGDLALWYIGPKALSSNKCAHRVPEEVEVREAQVVMIDGTAGYRLSPQGGNGEFVAELHALFRNLRTFGVTVILVEETENVTGEFRTTSEKISYLWDNIVFLRYLELRGEIRRVVGVLKKRLGAFEPTLRELRITEDGLWIGGPLDELRGVLTGTPAWSVEDAE